MNGRRWLVTTAAGLAAVVGGGAALATTGSSDPNSDFLGDVAKRLGISQDKLERAIEDASIARIDAAVERGDLTKEQGEELKKHVRSGDGPEILPGFRGPKLGIGPIGPPGRGFFPGPFPGFDFLQSAADYLGVDAADVRKALGDGKSLAELAKDKGKSVDGLEQALREAIRNDADEAVDHGALTKEQADRIAEKLGSAVDDLVEGGRFQFKLRIRPKGVPPPDEHPHPAFDPA
jgi:polyhydroxyalkanoate synthesis regulator phasin